MNTKTEKQTGSGTLRRALDKQHREIEHGATGEGDAPSVEIIENKLSDGSKTYDVRFMRQGEAVLIPMRDIGSAIGLHNQISVQIKFGQIL